MESLLDAALVIPQWVVLVIVGVGLLVFVLGYTIGPSIIGFGPRIVRKLALLIANSAFLVVFISLNAPAAYGENSNSENDLYTLEQPTVRAEDVAKVLKKERSIKLVNTKVEGDLQLYTSQIDQFSAEETIFRGDLDIDPCVEQHSGDCDPSSNSYSGFQFTASEFLGRVDFADYDYPPDLYFENLTFTNCEFHRGADFSSIYTNQASFVRSVFHQDVVFTSSNVGGSLDLRDARLQGFGDFAGSDFGQISTYGLWANEPVYIRWLQFPDDWVDQQVATFSKEKPADIKRVYWPQLEATLLFWKKNFTELGYQRDAQQVNFEIITHRRELEGRSDIDGLMGFGDRLVTTILGPPSNFGSEPYRPLGISFIAIPLAWLAYWILGSRRKVFVKMEEEPIREKRPLVLFSLLYSIDTFIPFVTVTGVKDWGWGTKGWSYWLIELPERLAGLYVFGAAAYSITYYAI